MLLLALTQITIAQVAPTPIYVLTDTGALATATLSAPGTTSTPIAITGIAAGETLVGIDVRPQNSALYGVGVDPVAETVQIYHITPQTGAAVAVGTPFFYTLVDGVTKVDLPPAGWDIDFNPAVDRLRLVAGSLNLRANPNNGTPVDGNAGMPGNNADGSFNGFSTVASATAYTNNQPNNGNITTQYTLDAATNALYIQNPPNNGTLTNQLIITVAGSPLDFTSVSGFDIEPGVNAAGSAMAVSSGVGYAVLTAASTSNLYQIDLTTGAATVIANFAPRSFTIRHRLPVSIALNDTGTSLVRFSPLNPSTTTSVALSGITSGEVIVGVDMRPATGQFYALGIDTTLNTGSLYLLDPQTGALATVGVAGQVAFVDAMGMAVPLPPASVGYDIDFNPTVDRVRVVSGSGLNFRVRPDTGAAVDGNAVTGGTNTDGSINGPTTGVNGTAYTNSFGGATATTQYTLDAVTNSLYIQNPPNNGTQTNGLPVTLAGSTLDFASPVGFDILGSVTVATSNIAATGDGFFVTSVGATGGVYRINLATGAATLLGTPGVNLSSFSIISMPTVATVTTPTVANLTPTSAVLGGTVSDDGGSAVTQRGIVLALTSASPTPSLGGTGVTNLPAGGTASTFTVGAPGLTTSASYSFRAYVTNALGTTYSAVRTFTPPILAQPVFPTTIVSQDYMVTLNFAPGTTFTSSLLPAGLKLDAKTGVIKGRPATPGSYVFTITAKGAGGATITYSNTLIVQALPRSAVGAFIGLVLPDVNLNGNAGGRIDLTTTNKGSYTLKLTQRTKSYSSPANSFLTTSVGANPTLTVTFTGGITVNLTLFPNDTVTGTLTVGADSVAISGWRKIYDKVFYPANPEMGYYSVSMKRTPVNAGNVIVPQGSGFASVLIGEDGSATFAGQSADGMPLTSGGFMGPNGEILVHAQTYTKLGAVLGILGQTNDPGDNYAENTITGSLYLTKPATTGRTYPAALNVLELETAGKYLAYAAKGAIVLGLPSTEDPSTLDFYDGGISLAAINPDLVDSVTLAIPSLKVGVPVAGSLQNPGRVALTINAATGSVTGTFKLSDAGRNAIYKFQGMIIRRADGSTTANGYFLLPQIPVGAETAANSPILSGSVDLVP
ncbi:hypothetical protein BGE01nite_15320 [Brevifollis gellanilyticus]|uniref:DUF4394 domain-containing protein n=1 Tax=Brevifollis gellanilyticus TaxID=748831 RepID=A0A512M7C0_9BACT|nr:hypothetical protein BGE01nite_15320 [Brevifollis gellanilyticus]